MAYRLKLDWKSKTYEGRTPSEIDWARMAAYIDGEGSVLINPRSGRKNYVTDASGFYLRITVANTDVRLPIWLKETFGGSYKDANTPKYYEGQNWKRAYHWNTASNRAAWILFNCLPYFVMKHEQAQIGISLQESMNKEIVGRTLPEDVVNERRELKSRLLFLKRKGAQAQVEQERELQAAVS